MRDLKYINWVKFIGLIAFAVSIIAISQGDYTWFIHLILSSLIISFELGEQKKKDLSERRVDVN